jgi:hypothetical protein
VRLNSSRELVVQSSGSPTGPFSGPEGQDPFWATDIFIWDLFGSREGIDITISPELPESSNPDAVPFTTAYYFPGTEALQDDHIMTLPLQMVHYTDTMNIHTNITMASQSPIGTLLSPRVTPTLPPRYRALNASILIPMQITSRSPGAPTASGHSPPVSFRHFLHPLSEDLFHPLSNPLILVVSFHRSHQITRFMLVDNFTKEAQLNPPCRENPNWNTTPDWRTTPTDPTL